MSSSILDRILADKRARLERGEYAPGSPAGRPTDGARFTASLREPGIRVIAEFKARSPSAGEIVAGADGKVESFALAYRRGHAAAMSIVVEEDHFGGRADWLTRAKRISGLPALMKDFVISERQLDFAVSLGADAVLLIVRALPEADLARLRQAAGERGLAVLAEAHDRGEISRASAVAPDAIGINARDLGDFTTDLALVESLVRDVPEGTIAVAESGIRTRADVTRLSSAGFRAFLVGEALLRAEDPEEELRELVRGKPGSAP
jgi:indole-3-glycerol phosphate synthase